LISGGKSVPQSQLPFEMLKRNKICLPWTGWAVVVELKVATISHVGAATVPPGVATIPDIYFPVVIAAGLSEQLTS
jgi:hypothetical protein